MLFFSIKLVEYGNIPQEVKFLDAKSRIPKLLANLASTL